MKTNNDALTKEQTERTVELAKRVLDVLSEQPELCIVVMQVVQLKLKEAVKKAEKNER